MIIRWICFLPNIDLKVLINWSNKTLVCITEEDLKLKPESLLTSHSGKDREKLLKIEERNIALQLQKFDKKERKDLKT